MEIELSKLKEIAIEYFDIENEDIFKSNFDQFLMGYNYIKNCDCVKGRDEESLINCLYFVASDIASNEFFKTTNDAYGNTFSNFSRKFKPLDFIISEALYRAYGDNSLSCLSDNYVHERKLVR